MPVFPAKKQKQQDKEAAQRQLPGRPVVVDHGDAQNLVAQIVDADQGTVAHGEELVLLQGAVEGVLASVTRPSNRPPRISSWQRCSPERTRPVSTTVDSSVASTRAGRMSDS